MTNPERLAYLFQRYLDRAETPEELEELMKLIETGEHKDAIAQLLDTARPGMVHTEKLDQEQSERLFQAIRQQTGSRQVVPITGPQPRRIGWRIAVAAAIILALSAGGYWLFFNKTGQTGEELATTQPATNDVAAPTTNKATITLTDGKTVAIDSLTSLTQGTVQLMRTAEGQIVYSGNAENVTYNTVSNPRGSQVIDMTLADGSKVWLNAGSSITYPVAFVGRERKVNITGEAYFEVRHDATKPFMVHFSSQHGGGREGAVQVLGTHFNVNAYSNEPEFKITLLEGSVKVAPVGSGQPAMLKPGQQARWDNGVIGVENDVNTAEVMAWKNGLFEFAETDIQSIMRQISRWYDVEVVFEGNVTQHFNGSIPRQVNVSKVLSILEKTGGVRFSIEGKKVLVRNY